MKDCKRFWIHLENGRAVVRAVRPPQGAHQIGFQEGYLVYGNALMIADRFNAIAVTKEEAERESRRGKRYLVGFSLAVVAIVTLHLLGLIP